MSLNLKIIRKELYFQYYVVVVVVVVVILMILFLIIYSVLLLFFINEIVVIISSIYNRVFKKYRLANIAKMFSFLILFLLLSIR
jgi:hypothetical protein